MNKAVRHLCDKHMFDYTHDLTHEAYVVMQPPEETEDESA